MTYCLGIITKEGLVIAADSRTNAGVDYISTYAKLFDFSILGQRTIILCVSGNLSITQAVLNAIEEERKTTPENSIDSCITMFQVASYIGSKVREIQTKERPWLEQDNIDYKCTLLLGGQLPGEECKLYMIYSQGNFIQATAETPFLQIGETKYGKPILDRTLTINTNLDDAAKCALLSIDSTMKSNISVGPPINMIMYAANTFKIEHQLKLGRGHPYLYQIRQMWENSLKRAFEEMPNIDWNN